MISRSRIFRWCLVSLVVGIAISESISLVISPFPVYCASLIALCGAVVAWRYRMARILFLLCFFLLFGIFRSLLQAPAEKMSYADFAIQQTQSSSLLSNVRTVVVSTISDHLPYAHAQLLGGILIGARQSLPKEIKDSFNRVGLSHIVAVSGYNITVLLAVLYTLAAGLGLRRTHSLVVVLICIAGFTILTGGSAATVRAAIMGGIVVVARALGRTAKMQTVIVLTAAGMLVQNPLVVSDIGFQLSFLAMLGLIYLSPLFENAAQSINDLFGLKSVLIQTLAAICATSPLILWYFGTISLIAPLANVLVVPIVPMAMAFGAGSVALSFLGDALTPYIWAFAWAPLEYIIRFSSVLSHISFASIELKQPLIIYALVVCSYAILMTIVLMDTSRRRRVCALL